MDLVEDFVKIRRDGKRIGASMDAQAILALGWRPDKVVRLEWAVDSHKCARDFEYGVLAKVAPDATAIALIEEVVESGSPGSSFSIINADGTNRYEISNTHRVNGEVLTGNFAWFEAPRQDPEHCIGIIFQAESASGPEQYQFDLDVRTGEVIEVRMAR